MGRKTLNVDEKTHRAIMEVVRKTRLNVSSLLRLVFVSRIPLDVLERDYTEQEVREEIPVEEILDRALKEAEREEMEERERREKEKSVRAKEKKEGKPKRIVGDDYKKFFAEKFWIPYEDDEK